MVAWGAPGEVCEEAATGDGCEGGERRGPGDELHAAASTIVMQVSVVLSMGSRTCRRYLAGPGGRPGQSH
jgi:hypothetical protein